MYKNFKYAILPLLFVSTSQYLNASSIQMTQEKEGSLYKFYGNIETRHHIDSFFNKNDKTVYELPSVEVRNQWGVLLYHDYLDVFLTLGAKKYSNTQQIIQRRPEINLDYYLAKNNIFRLRTYLNLKLPYQNNEPAEYLDKLDRWDQELYKDGSITKIGLSATASFGFNFSMLTLTPNLGTDLSTRFFSQKQYLDPELIEYTENSAGSRAENSEIEDTVSRLKLNQFFGTTIRFNNLPSIRNQVQINYTSQFFPKYIYHNGYLDFKYIAERYSFYKLRTQMELSNKVSLINDFYHYHNGFFSAKRTGIQRRFRNVLRLTCLF